MQLLYVPPHLLDAVWGLILPGLESVQKHSAETDMIEEVSAAVSCETASLHIGFDPDYRGFIVLKPEQFLTRRNLHVWCYYTIGNRFDMSVLDSMARKLGAKTMTFKSNRPGWKKNRFGFKPIYTVYRRDL